MLIYFSSLNLTVFHSRLPTFIYFSPRPTLFCFAIVVLPCSSNLPCTIICWIWFNMYWKHLYVGGKKKKERENCCICEHHTHCGFGLSRRRAQSWKPLQRRHPGGCESSLMRQLLSCVAHLHLWWLLFKMEKLSNVHFDVMGKENP